MGTPIMANKTEEHNPTNSNLFLVTNTICSASIIKRLGDGDYSVLQLHVYGVFFLINNFKYLMRQKIIFIKSYI